MKQGSNSRRPRGRGNGKRQPKNQNFDSNGPDGRVRGNASQIHEKYLAMARDALSSGDPVAYENYSQHAEHFFRVMAARAEANEKKAEGRNENRGGEKNDRSSGRKDQRGDQRDRNNQRNQRRNGNIENTASAEDLSPAAIVEGLNTDKDQAPEAELPTEEIGETASNSAESTDVEDGQEQASA
jgi:hypothetical protein